MHFQFKQHCEFRQCISMPRYQLTWHNELQDIPVCHSSTQMGSNLTIYMAWLWSYINIQPTKPKLNVCITFQSHGLKHAGVEEEKLVWKQISPVQSLSCVQLFVTPWTAAHQTSPSITNSQSLPKLMSIESVMPSSHLILCCPLLLLPSTFPNIRVFSNESALWIRWPKYWVKIILQDF